MADAENIRRQCRHLLGGHGPLQSIAESMRAIADGLDGDEQPDMYGEGPYLAAFEREVAELFGKDAAVFMPSGTMAQQIALRLWCEQSRNFTVAMHPSAHLEFAEQLGYQFLHGIHRLQFGVPEQLGERLLTRADLESLGERPGAILLELPCRPLGGELPSWDALKAISEFARAKGIPLHMDGARVWQCQAWYGKSLAEIAALFDSLYVSFYKDIGGLCGCMLLGPADFIKAGRVWQRRHGGNLFTQAPFVASSRLRMHEVLPQLDGWVRRARELAGIMQQVDGVSVHPAPPHVNFFRVFLRGDTAALGARHLALAEETGAWLFSRLEAASVPGIATTEVHVWENAMRFDTALLAPFLARLLGDG